MISITRTQSEKRSKGDPYDRFMQGEKPVLFSNASRRSFGLNLEKMADDSYTQLLATGKSKLLPTSNQDYSSIRPFQSSSFHSSCLIERDQNLNAHHTLSKMNTHLKHGISETAINQGLHVINKRVPGLGYYLEPKIRGTEFAIKSYQKLKEDQKAAKDMLCASSGAFAERATEIAGDLTVTVLSSRIPQPFRFPIEVAGHTGVSFLAEKLGEGTQFLCEKLHTNENSDKAEDLDKLSKEKKDKDHGLSEFSLNPSFHVNQSSPIFRKLI